MEGRRVGEQREFEGGEECSLAMKMMRKCNIMLLPMITLLTYTYIQTYYEYFVFYTL